MIRWVKEKLGITALEKENELLKSQMRSHREFVTNRIADLKEYTRVDADVGFRGNNTVIVTGVYRKQAFVQFYDMGGGEFERLVDHLRTLKYHAVIRHIDAPPSFRGAFDL